MDEPTNFLKDYGTYIVNSGIALFASFSTWYLSKKKARADDFDQLSKANKEFRDEVRLDLKNARDRISQLELTINSKDLRIRELENEVESLRDALSELQRTSMSKFPEVPNSGSIVN